MSVVNMVWLYFGMHAILAKMIYLDSQVQRRLDQDLAILKKLRPLPPTAVAKLKEQFAVEMTYNSNSIEGNTLTLKETHLVLNEGITIKGKSLKDHLEAKNHHEALHYLYELVDHKAKNTVSEQLIRSLQQMIVRETGSSVAGKYRSGAVIITGSKHVPPDAHEVPHQMQRLIRWFKDQEDRLHPIELAAIAHHKFVHIHPFFDGNGRAARLFLNLILMQKGYPLVIILKHDRKKYYNVLQKADAGDLKPIVRFIAQSVERSLHIHLKVLQPQKKKQKKYLPLSTIAPETPYSEKYLNLLARFGRIEAHKEGRIWVSTLEAVKVYQAGRLRKRT